MFARLTIQVLDLGLARERTNGRGKVFGHDLELAEGVLKTLHLALDFFDLFLLCGLISLQYLLILVVQFL